MSSAGNRMKERDVEVQRLFLNSGATTSPQKKIYAKKRARTFETLFDDEESC
jgi:hypothetical protein